MRIGNKVINGRHGVWLVVAAGLALGLATVANAADKAMLEVAVKTTLHKISCAGQSDRIGKIREIAVEKAGGIRAITPMLIKLQSQIMREGVVISDWCDLLDQQFGSMEKLLDLRAGK